LLNGLANSSSNFFKSVVHGKSKLLLK
jgi:hypothetical protein